MGLWTQEQDDILRRYQAENYSFSEIASLINARTGSSLSRNAAIGRAHRLGITSSIIGRPAKPARDKLSNHGIGPVVQKINRMKRGEGPKAIKDDYKFNVADVVSLRLPLLSLGAMQCRWPDDSGDPANGVPHTFCGNRTADGSSYCPAHAQLNRGRGTPAERSAESSAVYAAKVAA